MPVLEQEVSALTQISADHRYGCHNKPADLKHRMSDRCRYDMSLSDPSCTDCQHRGKGIEYVEMVRRLGK